MSESSAHIWIALSVSMPSYAGSDVEDYVPIPRAEWEAMTEDEREARIQEETDAFLANSVDAGGGVVDASEVPAEYLRDAG
jgi:hypothetical protein